MQLIKLTDEHYVVVTDEEFDPILSDGKYVYKGGRIWQWEKTMAYMGSNKPKVVIASTQPLEKGDEILNEIYQNKIIKGYDKIKPIDLSYIKSLVGEVDVEKIAVEWLDGQITICFENYSGTTLYHRVQEKLEQAKQMKKNNRFSEEDMRKAIEMARQIKDDSAHDTFTAEDISGCTEVCTYGWKQKYSDEDIISSLTQPKDTWDVEFIDGQLKLK